jgi:mannosyl-glycoprotein endo-beta-N-acetylglucosaminidase
MASDIKALKSYLVRLGFDANEDQFLKFESKLKQAANLVKSSTFTMGANLLKWQIAVTGMFVGIGTAVVGTIAEVAKADQEYRLFGQRMFLNTQQARSLKIALDALGQPLEAIAFDPELHGRYEQLKKDQALLSAGLGGDYEGTMRQIRDVMFEFTRLEVEFKYFVMSVAKNIFKAMGGGDFIAKLHQLNDWIIKNIPKWSTQFTTYLLPILKDVWQVLKDTGALLWNLGLDFANLVNGIAGDSDAMKSSMPAWEKFARAIDHVVKLVYYLVEGLIWLENHKGILGLIVGAIGGFAVGGPWGALAGSVALGGSGFAMDYVRSQGGGGIPDAPRGTSGAGSNGIADQARALAAQVGPQLGVDPSIIFAQWAHETGNFTNRGATQLNNLAGINVPGGNGSDYKSYSSLNEFAQDYASLISRRYKGALGAGNVDDYATALKRGGYFSGPLNDYEHGMKGFQGSYSGGASSTHVGTITVNVNGSNATPDDIKNKVLAALQEHTALQTKRSLVQTRSVYA